MHPWEWPTRPWMCIHVDYAGPFMGKMFWVVSDAHSKWLEIEMVLAATSRATVMQLRRMFAIYRLPELLVSDNGSAFVSKEFEDCLKGNRIRHVTSVPYHPSSNGLAERSVQTFKNSMKKGMGNDLERQLFNFLFHYKTTPHTTTGVSPAELMMVRQLRTKLDLMRPCVGARVVCKQEKQLKGISGCIL